MKNVNRWIGVIVGGLILSCATSAFAQDWPQWRGANRDGKATGFTAPENWPKELTPSWKATVGAGDSTPALVGDKLYVFGRQGADEVVLCLNATDGKEVWKHAYPATAISGPAARVHPGPRSSPAVADGKVVVIGVNGNLLCLDAATGNAVWKNDEFKTVPRFYTATSPMIVDGMVVVQMGGQGNGALMAFDLATGNVKWKWAGEAPMYSSPVLMTAEGVKQIVTLTEKSLVGVALADGKFLWQVPFAPQGMAYNAATPIVDGQTVIFTGSGRGTKAVKIEKQGDGFAARELWSNGGLAVQFNTPVLKDGLLFGLSDKGNLFCINAQDGKTAWLDKTAHGRGFAAIVDAGTVLMALPSTSEFIVYKPDGKEYSEIARIKAADTETYAYPVVAGDRIFVRDRDALMLFTTK